jgi:polysaccharide biosynthesis protein PslG
MRRFVTSTLSAAVTAGLAVSLLSAAPAQATTSGGPVDNNMFGLHVPNISQGETPNIVYGDIRLWDSGIAWGQVQQQKNLFWWNGMDAAIANANAQGVQVTFVLGSTPTWAATNRGQGTYPNRGAASVPKMADWKRWVDIVSKRYGASIESYQIWNEANLQTFWQGSPKQMAQLTREAYRIIRRNDPTAKVVSASSTMRLQSAYKRFFPAYMKELRKMNWPIDAVSVHMYPDSKGTPFTRAGYIQQVKADMRKAKVPRSKELWDTEVNYGVAGPTKSDKRRSIGGSQAAAYVAQTYLDNIRLGVDRAYWYYWFRNTPRLGIQMNAGAPAAIAYQTVEGWLEGSYYDCVTSAVNVCYLGDNTDVRTVAWASRGSSQYNVPLGVTITCNALNQCSPVVPGTRVTIGSMPQWFGNPAPVAPPAPVVPAPPVE